jgi:3-dehydroquinate synthase
VVIGDSNTSRLFGRGIARALKPSAERVTSLEFPAGERSKTRRTKERIEDAMLEAGAGRDACVVAVGGGVVTDLAGYVAATYMRGLPLINVATTVLAQVDAAIGGKTGVNTPLGKNLVGAFHPATAVVLHTRALGSLPLREIRSGLAEAIKNAFIADRKLFEELERCEALPGRIPQDLLFRCAKVKERVAAADPLDRGRRQILNFGHTAGHAIESALRYRIPHGYAVAAGMAVEGALARVPGLDRLLALLRRVGLPTGPPCDFETAASALRFDKKRSGGAIRCALPLDIGRMDESDGTWLREVSRRDFRAAWERARK